MTRPAGTIAVPAVLAAAAWCLWLVDLALIITGSVLLPLQDRVPWESSGLSHFLAYLVLGFVPVFLWPGRARVLVTWGGASALGAVLEWVQTALPDRYGTIEDAAINAAGAGAGVVLGWLAGRVMPMVVELLRSLSGARGDSGRDRGRDVGKRELHGGRP